MTMLAVIWKKIGETGMTLIGLAILLLVFLGPWLIARVIPVQAYNVTEVAALVALLVGILAAICAIAKPIRRLAGAVLFACSFAVWAFVWVWSVLIVDGTWGIIALYVANFFLAVGAIVLALAAALFGFHWSILGQLVLCIVIALAMGLGGSAMLDSAER